MSEGTAAVRTLIVPLTQVDSFDVHAEIARMAVCFAALRTLIVPLLQVNSLDMTGQVT